MSTERKVRKIVNLFVILAMVFSMLIPASLPANAASSKLTASGSVKSAKGAIIRKAASINSKGIAKVKKNTKLTIYSEVFTSKTDTRAVYRWYYVKAGRTKGYIRSDMVKSFKYKAKSGKTTDALFYRAGVGTKMKKKGMYKKGAKVNVMLEAYQRGSKEKWYKVKVGKNYYYSCARWISVKGVTSSSKTGTSKSSSSSSSSSGDSIIVTKSDDGNVTNTVTGATIPSTIGFGCPFSIIGKVKSTGVIKSAAVAIVKSNGSNAICVRKQVNGNTFNISSVDADVRFGTLPAGKYKYLVKIYVGNKGYPVIYKDFKVVKGKRSQMITNKAFELAWPKGTSDRTSEYGSGRATPAFRNAINQVYPSRSRWGAPSRVGASCDVFAGTVVSASGVDSVPRGMEEQLKYYRKSKKWTRVKYNGNRNVLRSGDVVIYLKNNGSGGHTFIYLVKNGSEYVAEASYAQFYGVINGSSAVRERFKTKGKTFYVYRIVE